jgi:hypothetical protein
MASPLKRKQKYVVRMPVEFYERICTQHGKGVFPEIAILAITRYLELRPQAPMPPPPVPKSHQYCLAAPSDLYDRVVEAFGPRAFSQVAALAICRYLGEDPADYGLSIAPSGPAAEAPLA